MHSPSSELSAILSTTAEVIVNGKKLRKTRMHMMSKHELGTSPISRRQLLNSARAFGLAAVLERLTPAWATAAGQTQNSELSGSVVDLVIAETPFRIGSRTGIAMTVNGTVPGPVIRLREGQDVTLNVTNRLKETSSLHCHGVLVPPGMDGVPGVSFGGIKPGETFTYRFPVRQSGTYFGVTVIPEARSCWASTCRC
jgi:hypothetical protein